MQCFRFYHGRQNIAEDKFLRNAFGNTGANHTNRRERKERDQMAQKIVGYREMLWTCPNCGAKNPGSSRICKSCGAAMGEEVNFEQQTSAGMISDEKIIEKAKSGPDIYCAYCGNRNPAGAKVCSRCGADLSEGKEREHGSQHSAHIEEHEHAEPVICPSCGTANPAGALKCGACGTPLAAASSEKEEIPASAPTNIAGGGKKQGCGKGCLFMIIILVLIGIFGFMMMSGGVDKGSWGNGFSFSPSTPIPNSVVHAAVSEQHWKTAVQVLGPVDTNGSAWQDQLPSDARNIRCQDKLRHTYDDEVAGSVEVCGTPYAIDMGNGYEQFVQDCVYQVYEPYCQYTVSKIGVIETRRANGSGLNPELPYVESQYSLGNQSASYEIILRGEDGREYTLSPYDLSDYRSFKIGDEYDLEVTSSGRIVNIMERK